MQSCIFYVSRYSRGMIIFDAPKCRAARGILGISQADLAASSGVSLRTIAGFESGKTAPIKANLAALQQALEAAGVRFTAQGVELTTAP